MGRNKKSGSKKPTSFTEKILLATAIIQLIKALIEMIGKLIE